MDEITICSNSKREIFYGKDGYYVYIPLTDEECSILGCDSTINAALRIWVMRKQGLIYD